MAVIFKIITDTPLNETADRVQIQAFDDATGQPFIDPSNNEPIIVTIDGYDVSAEVLGKITAQALADITTRATRKAEKLAALAASRASRAALAGGVTPPKVPTKEEADELAARKEALAKRDQLALLRTIRKPDDVEVLALQDEIDVISKAHPEWFTPTAIVVKTK